MLRLRSVPPGQGVVWVRQGFRAFVRRPMSFTALLLAFFFASLLVSVLVPFVGSLVSLMALPLLSLGFMIATRSAATGGAVHVGQLIQPLRVPTAQRKRLLVLCALYGVATMAVLMLSDRIIGSAWDELHALYAAGGPVNPDQARTIATDPRLLWGFGTQALLISALSIPFWHAPALVMWGKQGVAQSLFSSTVALWRTKGAFAAYTMAWLVLLLAFGTVTTLLFALFGLPQLAPVAALPIALMCMTVFYVTLYFIFADTFEAPPSAAAPQSETAA